MEKLIFEAFPDAKSEYPHKIIIPTLNTTAWYLDKDVY